METRSILEKCAILDVYLHESRSCFLIYSFSSEMARRIFDLSNALHDEQVQNILIDDETDPIQLEDLGEESDIDSEDDVEECPDVSDTDQDGESEEDAQDIQTYYFSGY
ncbi:uncharacterized protein LOC143806542 [Ranitomeya variabilis]|uniref:uncharacterized protein LOC143806542 n=1 Tax=Ranitomeya variabilis TaxID=490064 RepID=UPI004057373C